MDSYTRVPSSVTLDIDDTVDVVHGYQQLSLFNAHYDERCFLPIHVYDTERSRPVAVVLRPGKTPSGVEVRSHLRRLVRRIRRRWPETHITFRGDGHYARPEAIFHTAAYWLLLTVRDAIPKIRDLATAEFATLRLRLLKIAVRVVETKSRVLVPRPICSADWRRRSSREALTHGAEPRRSILQRVVDV
jgi:hypothetical protein